MQKIKRTDLVNLYNAFTCGTWREKITPYLIENTDDFISIKKEDIVYAAKKADAYQKKALEKAGIDFDKVETLSSLKSYEDACCILRKIPNKIATPSQKLCTIIKAANFLDNDEKEWKADFNNINQYKYLPYWKKGLDWNLEYIGCWTLGATCPAGFYFKSSEIAQLIANRFTALYLQWLKEEEIEETSFRSYELVAY